MKCNSGITIARPTVETVMIIFLKANSIEITCTNEELAALGWGLADGSITKEELVDWIISHSHHF